MNYKVIQIKAAINEDIPLEASNSAFDDLPQELELYKSDIDFPRLNIELKMLPDLMKVQDTKSPNTLQSQ